ncbi:putative alpha-l-rhamnosidase c protein [Botrytis fragariae]|uniref:Putative alpha-l-rhamnosidase c protein n=1 Tax=Botrytis fragariae TaxID=1964551 RepID=A0A8H6AUL9_9HELO|nr:putative alpha-l-rhamnosidase c protein [Botrytis fragariae]KAF5873891.1 putative alpha-l-rhamnosidase c protein [Botrytis fragariae]
MANHDTFAAGGDNHASTNTNANANANTASPSANYLRQDEQSSIEPSVLPFPLLDGSSPPNPSSTSKVEEQGITRSRGASSTLGSIRRVSRVFEESNPPTGFCIASGQIASQVPSITDIRRGSFGVEGWSSEGQVREIQRRTSSSRSTISQLGDQDKSRRKDSTGMNTSDHIPSGTETKHDVLPEAPEEEERTQAHSDDLRTTSTTTNSDVKKKVLVKPNSSVRISSDTNRASHNAKIDDEYRTTPFDNGYQFPPKHSWQVSTAIFFKAFWKFFITPVGFLVTVYGLNVVAWGGMLFLLLCNASPAMCKPTCNDINSPRRVWIEIDSQILNALFCVTGFGTIPWRFRDLYYLLQYRIGKNELGLRRLAGINRSWFRLAGSQSLSPEIDPSHLDAQDSDTPLPQSSLAYPLSKSPDAPLTGVRAPATAMWKLDFVVWTMVWNTFLQAVLSGFMWGLNRYDRPSWSTGLFVALACMVAAAGGIMSFVEAKKVKAIEGVPVSEEDRERLRMDRELGVLHYNNIKDEGPKEKEKEGKGKRTKGEKSRAEEARMQQSIEEGVAQVVR